MRVPKSAAQTAMSSDRRPDRCNSGGPGETRGLKLTKELNMTMKNIVIFDLDGTLSDCEHRRHLIAGEQKDWDAFYKACVGDSPIWPTIRLLSTLRRHCEIVIMTGRSDLVKDETLTWLNEHGIRFDQLYMRPHGDHTQDHVLKQRWLEELGGPKRVLCVFEDRGRVVDMWRGQGILCCQVAPGDF